MILPLLNSLFDPLIAGLLLTCLLWPKGKISGPNCLVISFLAVGYGFGAISLIYFLWLALSAPFSAFIVLEIAILAALWTILYFTYKKWKLPDDMVLSLDLLPKTKIDMFAAAAFLIIIFASAMFYIHHSFRMPHGEWDAWAIWNMRARFLFREGVVLKNTFSPALAWSHPDYPLFLPVSIVRFWNYIGRETQAAPAVMGAVFTFSTVGLIFASLLSLRGLREALLAAIVLLATSIFMVLGASQYADIPLAYFILATIVLFCFNDRSEGSGRGFVVLSGVMAGLAGWTKNEGLLFLAVVIVARFATVMILKGRKRALGELLSFFVGALPVLAVIAYFKFRFAPANDMLAQAPAVIIAKLTNFAVYYPLAKLTWQKILGFGSIALGAIPLLALYLFLMGVRIEKRDLPAISVGFGVPGIMLAAYVLIYAISPYDIAWQMATSIDRLILQLWPSLVFMAFLIVRNDIS